MRKALLVGNEAKTSNWQSDLEGDGFHCHRVATVREALAYLSKQAANSQITLFVENGVETGTGPSADPRRPNDAVNFLKQVRDHDMVSPDLPAYIVAVNTSQPFPELPENTHVIEYGSMSIAKQLLGSKYRNDGPVVNPARYPQGMR
jgi:hypothetical protein